MTSVGTALTRTSSTDSSAMSNIIVARAVEDDSASEGISASTPPTSLTDSGSLGSAKATTDTLDTIHEERLHRPKRARSSVSTYNLAKLAEQQLDTAPGSRNVSGLTGKTLVDDDEDEYAAMGSKVDKDIDSSGDGPSKSAELPQRRSPRKLQRRPTVKDRVKKAAGKVTSVLGKRGRDVVQAGKRKLGMHEAEADPQTKKVLKELDMGSKGILDEMDLSDDAGYLPPPRPAKKARLDSNVLQDTKQTVPTAPPLKITSGKAVKKWQQEGLYVGQDTHADPTQSGSRKKLQKKRPTSSASDLTPDNTGEEPTPRKTFMPLPMFKYLDSTRNFTIPFDIYAPSARKGDEKPKDWHKLNRNRLVGEAKELWEKAEKLPNSACVCRTPSEDEQGCGDDCLNRVMQYECNDDNCKLPASLCSNRAFAELAARTKKGRAFDVGVEVVKTGNRGFGVRSCRTFVPGQIIMEYTGEIISEGECQRRMAEDYKDKQCYYLMELERGLIIDGTKGSVARFINHSCSPNCEVRMVKVSGTPRMAVFAGEDGVMTGDELTYDYNFDNFGATKQLCYCGASNCRGTLSKRLNAAEQKKLAREEGERRRKAAEEARKIAEAEAKKNLVKKERGSGWRGWVAVDDPETKEKLKREKKEREEAQKSSERARRLAARMSGTPMSASKRKASAPLPIAEKKDAKRRKTVHALETVAAPMHEEIEVAQPARKVSHIRTVSTSSKFTEEFHLHEPEVSVSTTTTAEEVREETRLLDENVAMTNGTEEKEAGRGGEAKSGLSRTASKGKEALKQVGLAVKGSLLGLDRNRPALGSGKFRQSTLSFGKLG
ncbi:hypothetical protein BDY17DRAFT_325651 [Neohortaea acidophila]|uniref:SET domain-containing protein n=1 Tax=Neohortaea acidophila TaxID=245834 RepID=A0A6A6PQ00_9PEZI|nr:uncharacterized protein BDY17DRAFT_325651 [Neohortaea acidophila]KAF2482169.1 hypothetical protein BDY17DRAFT_325651 [Neohortaea acidophila]